MEQIITLLFLGLSLMMFTFAALLLSARTRTAVSYWLSGYIFSVGYIWLYYGLYRSTRLSGAPWLLYSDVCVTFLVGPLLYTYACGITGATGFSSGFLKRRQSHRQGQIQGHRERQIQGKREWRLLHFAPACIVLAFLIILRPSVYVSPAALQSTDPDHFALAGVDVLNKIGDACFFGYVLASTHLVLRTYKNGKKQFRREFRGVVIYFLNGLLTFAGFLAGHLLRNAALLGTAVLLNGLNTAYYFFYSYRFPEHSQRPPRPAPSAGRVPVVWISKNDEKILRSLKEHMERSHDYRDSNLTLQSLSTRLGIQHHQLSQILNRRLSTNFRCYINGYRLEEARQLLLKEPEASILEIAFAVGFNSKSAFNAAFSKATGHTPSDFRKTHIHCG